MANYELNRFNPFDDSFFRNALQRAWRDFPMMTPMPAMDTLALDMFEKDGALYVKAGMPGIGMKDVKITIQGDLLTITAEKKMDKEIKETDYYLRETSMGAWNRSVRLPADVQADKATATLENGMLTVAMPKVMATKPHPVEVKVQSYV